MSWRKIKFREFGKISFLSYINSIHIKTFDRQLISNYQAIFIKASLIRNEMLLYRK